MIKYYRESYTRALTEFCEDWWPCSFPRCVNTKRGHIRGHQDDRGHIISTKPYQSADNFNEQTFGSEWDDMLNRNLQNIRESMDRMTNGSAGMKEEEAAEELHLKRMNEFYSELGELSCYMNHSACFCCLRELAEHPLPCGHVICTPCVKSYARVKNQVTYGLKSCPLHWHEGWEQEWEIPVKPHMAGIRILTLDG